MKNPTGTKPPTRYRDLTDRFANLPREEQVRTAREADGMRESHTIYAAWSVAITSAEGRAYAARIS